MPIIRDDDDDDGFVRKAVVEEKGDEQEVNMEELFGGDSEDEEQEKSGPTTTKILTETEDITSSRMELADSDTNSIETPAENESGVIDEAELFGEMSSSGEADDNNMDLDDDDNRIVKVKKPSMMLQNPIRVQDLPEISRNPREFKESVRKLVRLDNKQRKIIGKIPSFLMFEAHTFDPDTFEDLLNFPEDSDNNNEDERLRALHLKLANTVRWRYKNAEKKTGMIENLAREKESNARMVKWSDGSFSLVVGDEIFDADVKPFLDDERVYLYSFHQDLVMFEGNGRLQEKMTFQPSSTASATHKRLTREILGKNSKETKVKYTITEKDPEKIRAEIEKAEQARLREVRKKQAKTRREMMGLRGASGSGRERRSGSSGGLTRALLEAEEEDIFGDENEDDEMDDFIVNDDDRIEYEDGAETSEEEEAEAGEDEEDDGGDANDAYNRNGDEEKKKIKKKLDDDDERDAKILEAKNSIFGDSDSDDNGNNGEEQESSVIKGQKKVIVDAKSVKGTILSDDED